MLNLFWILENLKSFVIESGSNSNGSYRKYNDGFIEQWGEDSAVTNTFPIPFTKSCTVTAIYVGTTNNNNEPPRLNSKSLTEFQFSLKFTGQKKSWYACGY